MTLPYRYDLHLHSEASSDCSTSYRMLLSMVKRRRLSGLAVTDHDTMDGVKRLQQLWPQHEHQLIPGCERTLRDGSHVIGLFIHEVPRGDSPQEVVEDIRSQGGIVYLPHPYRKYSGLLGEGAAWNEDAIHWTLENVDIIEVYNSKCSMDENRRASDLASYLAKSFAASSDAHAPHEIGIACTEFEFPLSPSSFKAVAAYAPPAAKAARLAARRRGEEPAARAAARDLLSLLGLFEPAKAIRNRWRCYQKPPLEKYR